MSTVLSIDTSDNKKISVSLASNRKKDIIISESKILRSQAVLSLIEKLLKRNNLLVNNIDEVQFNPGPGSFTGLRVGAAIANALGSLLKKPVNGKRIGELAEPVYNK